MSTSALEHAVESDDSTTSRYQKVDNDSTPPTAGDLARLAAAEAQFYAIEYDELRTDPEFLKEQVEEAARHRTELLPDAQGNAPDVKTLLSNSRFVGQMVRFTIHNTLLHLGMWTLAEKYLSEIQELDQTQDRFGVLRKRDELMGYVKFVIEQQIDMVDKRVRHALLYHIRERSLWIRQSNHPDYTGASCTQNPEKDEEFRVASFADTVDGAFVRFVAEDLMRLVDWTVKERANDLFSRLDKEPERWETFDTRLAELLTQLKRMLDFVDMLNHPGPGQMPPDDRFKKYDAALHQSEKTFTSIALERHIKNIGSLERSNAFDKLWKDIEHAFSKRHNGSPVKYMGFVPFGPKWYIPDEVLQPESPPPRAPSPPPSPELAPRPIRVRPPPAVRPPSPAPVKLKPYYASASQASSAPSLTPDEALRDKGPKTRNRHEANTTSPEEGESATLDDMRTGMDRLALPNNEVRVDSSSPSVVFYVSKRAYDIFERILNAEKGQLSFDDLKFALGSIGFEHERGSGSRGIFYPTPRHKNTPFFVHLPHGPRTTLYHRRLKRIAKHWRLYYGWSIGWFALRSST